MSVRSIEQELRKAGEEDAVVFRIVVMRDGSMSWKTPRSGDPMTDEILARGWLDKVRETILLAMMAPPSNLKT